MSASQILQPQLVSIPIDLREDLPVPDVPWEISPRIFSEMQSQSHRPYKKIQVLPTDDEWRFIWRYFHHDKPLRYTIGRVYCIHERHQQHTFETNLSNQEREAGQFKSAWIEEPRADQRAQAIARWRQSADLFSPFRSIEADGRERNWNKTKVLPLWHGSKKEVCASVASSGFTYFGKTDLGSKTSSDPKNTDEGLFGSGIYFTNSARYAADIYGSGCLLLAWVSMREPFPVVGDPKQKDMHVLKGKGAYKKYNAHYIPVTPKDPNDPFASDYFPTQKTQSAYCDEFVIFQKSQAIARFWVDLQLEQTVYVSVTPCFVNQFIPYLFQVLQNKEVDRDIKLRKFLNHELATLLTLSGSEDLESRHSKLYSQLSRLLDSSGKVDMQMRNMVLQSSQNGLQYKLGLPNLWNLIGWKDTGSQETESIPEYDGLLQLSPAQPLPTDIPLEEIDRVNLLDTRMKNRKLIQWSSYLMPFSNIEGMPTKQDLKKLVKHFDPNIRYINDGALSPQEEEAFISREQRLHHCFFRTVELLVTHLNLQGLPFEKQIEYYAAASEELLYLSSGKITDWQGAIVQEWFRAIALNHLVKAAAGDIKSKKYGKGNLLKKYFAAFCTFAHLRHKRPDDEEYFPPYEYNRTKNPNLYNDPRHKYMTEYDFRKFLWNLFGLREADGISYHELVDFSKPSEEYLHAYRVIVEARDQFQHRFYLKADDLEAGAFEEALAFLEHPTQEELSDEAKQALSVTYPSSTTSSLQILNNWKLNIEGSVKVIKLDLEEDVSSDYISTLDDHKEAWNYLTGHTRRPGIRAKKVLATFDVSSLDSPTAKFEYYLQQLIEVIPTPHEEIWNHAQTIQRELSENALRRVHEQIEGLSVWDRKDKLKRIYDKLVQKNNARQFSDLEIVLIREEVSQLEKTYLDMHQAAARRARSLAFCFMFDELGNERASGS